MSDNPFVKLRRGTAISKFEVWNPRWHDRTVLLMDFKLGFNNVITFPKSKALEGEWYLCGTDVKNYPTEPFTTKAGKTITMRAVPLADLRRVEWVDEND